MQVKSIAKCSKGEHSAILSTFVKLPFVIKIFVLSVFEWPFYCSCFILFRTQVAKNTKTNMRDPDQTAFEGTV